MSLQEFVKSDCFMGNLFTLFVSTDKGKTWVRMFGGNNRAAMENAAEELLSGRSVTHYVLARGDYNELN